MKKLGRILTIAALSLGIASFGNVASAKDWKEVVIGTEGSFPPFNATNPDGTFYGFEIDLADDLCARMKLKCTFMQQSFDGIIPALQAGKFDVIMSGMSQTPERAKVILFSRPYISGSPTFGVQKSGDLANLPLNGQAFNLDSDPQGTEKAIEESKSALKGKIIGVQSGSVHAKFLEKYFADTSTIRLYKSAQEQNLDLTSGRIDAIFASNSYLTKLGKESSSDDMIIAGPLFKGGMFGKGSSIGLRTDDTDLKAMFDEAINAATADGTMKTLSTKWFGLDLSVY